MSLLTELETQIANQITDLRKKIDKKFQISELLKSPLYQATQEIYKESLKQVKKEEQQEQKQKKEKEMQKDSDITNVEELTDIIFDPFFIWKHDIEDRNIKFIHAIVPQFKITTEEWNSMIQNLRYVIYSNYVSMLSDENRNQYISFLLSRFSGLFSFLRHDLSEIPDVEKGFYIKTKIFLHDFPIYKQFLQDILRNHE